MRVREIVSFIIVSSTCLVTTSAHAGTVAVELQSKSLVILPTENNAAHIRFTTPDGKTTEPLHFMGGDGTLGFSYELKPLNQATNYETDIVLINRSAPDGPVMAADVIGYGRTVFSFPDHDVNENGVLDVLEADQDADGWFYGQTTIDQITGPNYFNSSFAGFFTKSTTYYGHWHVDMVDAPGDGPDDMETLGTIELLRATGSGEYDRTQKKPELRFALSQMSFLGDVTYTGAAPLQVRSPDEISLPSFRLQRSDGATLVSTPATLRRTGNRYSGTIGFDDGDPATPWKDYTDWTLHITDPSDADADGVPELSDVPPPQLVREPKDRTVKEGRNASFKVVARGRGKKTYQWHFNGVPIEGATKPVLRLKRVTGENAGEYSVHVIAKDGGTAVSRNALLTVQTAPPAP